MPSSALRSIDPQHPALGEIFLTIAAAGKDEALTELVWMLLSLSLWMEIFLRKEAVLEMGSPLR